MSDELERHRSFVQALATPDGYEAVALCPHINGYFDKDTSLTESGLISAECQECGWVSATAPHTKFRVRGFGFAAAAMPPPPAGVDNP